MKNEHEAVRCAVIAFYRDEIARRYELDNIRRFQSLARFPDAQLESLRVYFLDWIYPPSDVRDRQDKAFADLNAALLSPRRIQPLLATALRSLFSFGAQIPSAIAAGMGVLDAYAQARNLEAVLMENVRVFGMSLADTRSQEKMLHLLAQVPEEDIKRLIQNVLKLFKALSNVKLLRAAADMFTGFKAVMEKRSDLYSALDVESIGVAADAIKAGLALVGQFKADEFLDITRGVELIEFDWVARVHAASNG